MIESKYNFKIGDKVILGKHDNEEFWITHMEKFVGTVTTITQVSRLNGYLNHKLWNVDNNIYHWRDINMIPAGNQPATSIGGSALGAHCKRCHDYLPYIDKQDGYTCWRCKH